MIEDNLARYNKGMKMDGRKIEGGIVEWNDNTDGTIEVGAMLYIF